MPQKDIAKACDVSAQAVSNWIHKKNYHPSDEASAILFRLAFHANPQAVVEVVQQDIKRYFKELRELGIPISRINRGVD